MAKVVGSVEVPVTDVVVKGESGTCRVNGKPARMRRFNATWLAFVAGEKDPVLGVSFDTAYFVNARGVGVYTAKRCPPRA